MNEAEAFYANHKRAVYYKDFLYPGIYDHEKDCIVDIEADAYGLNMWSTDRNLKQRGTSMALADLIKADSEPDGLSKLFKSHLQTITEGITDAPA